MFCLAEMVFLKKTAARQYTSLSLAHRFPRPLPFCASPSCLPLTGSPPPALSAVGGLPLSPSCPAPTASLRCPTSEPFPVRCGRCPSSPSTASPRHSRQWRGEADAEFGQDRGEDSSKTEPEAEEPSAMPYAGLQRPCTTSQLLFAQDHLESLVKIWGSGRVSRCLSRCGDFAHI